MQALYVDSGNGSIKQLFFDRSWRDNGKDSEYAMVGGAKILISQGSRPKPEIFQNGTSFFYKDGTPVTRLEDVDYLPEKYRALAVKFIEKSGEKPVKVAPTKPGRQRGRPKKTEPVTTSIEIKDEESYRRAGGKPVTD